MLLFQDAAGCSVHLRNRPPLQTPTQ